MIKWCWNSKTGEIFDYNEYSNGETNFPRGDFIVYDDYLVTGFKAKEEAIEYSKKNGACLKCKSSSSFPICFRCKEKTIQNKLVFNN